MKCNHSSVSGKNKEQLVDVSERLIKTIRRKLTLGSSNKIEDMIATSGYIGANHIPSALAEFTKDRSLCNSIPKYMSSAVLAELNRAGNCGSMSSLGLVLLAQSRSFSGMKAKKVSM